MAFSPAQVEQLLRPVNPRRVQRDNHGMSHLAAYDVSELVAEDGIIDKQRDRLGWGMDRPKRLATISDIVGRAVTSSNELSYTEAAQVLGKLSGVRA